MIQPWIACQLGHRERFAVPRALRCAGGLKALITDAWTAPGSSLARLIDAQGAAGRAAWFGERFDPDLSGAHVVSFDEQALMFEAAARARRATGWERIMARNAWFQARAAEAITPLLSAGDSVFAYSYAAREILAVAKAHGCRTVLGQIDAGPHEEDIVAAEVAARPDVDTGFRRAPERYWTEWASECALADVIVVNSSWSARAMAMAGVPAAKIRVVPLAHEPRGGTPAARSAPRAFSAERPLRALFLGQVIARKGIFRLLEAADLVQTRPVEITVAGEASPAVAEVLARHSNIRWAGAIPRARVGEYYQRADVFLLPTLSDGFALTQLEAAEAGVPIVASDRCGAVIAHERGGLILPEISGPAIADALIRILDEPECLDRWRADLATISGQFSLDRLSERLLEI